MKHKPSTTEQKQMPESLPYSLSVTPLGSRLAVILLAIVVAFGLQWLFEEPATLIEERMGSLAWQMKPDTTPEERIVIVAIDDESLQELGAWPWSRATFAELSDRLKEYGVTSQVYDLVFPEARQGDPLLNQALLTNNALVGQIPQLDVQQKSYQTGVLTGALNQACHPAMPVAHGYLANNSGLILGAGSGVNAPRIRAGHISPEIDPDGAVRFQAPLVCYKGQVYPSLALAALLHNLNITDLEWSADSEATQAPWLITSRDYPLLQIPVNNEGLMRVDYSKAPGSFTQISAADVIAGRIDPNRLKNRWVVVGATAFGLGDLVPSPHSGLTPGVEIQARMIASLLDQQVPYTPKVQIVYQVSSIGLALLLLLLLSSRVNVHQNRLSRAALLSAPLLFPLAAIGVHFWGMQHQLWLGWLPLALYSLIAALSLTALEYLRNRHEKQRLYDNLSSYLPENIANEIAFHLPTGQLHAKKSRCIILSADLRNFSAYQQKSSPEATVHLLHGFFTLASQAISKHQGTLYELKADALLAVWSIEDDIDPGANQDGSEQSNQQHAENAWLAASAIHQAVQPLLEKTALSDTAPLGLGIGISVGSVTHGRLGSARHRTQMILGEAVTQALSLQSMTQDLAYPTLCSEALARYLPKQSCQAIGSYLLESARRPQVLYAPSQQELLKQVPTSDLNDSDDTDELHQLQDSSVTSLQAYRQVTGSK